MAQSNKKRINYFDMAKGVGILCVVTYHLLGSLDKNDSKPAFPYIMQYIVTIALPIFFIVAGMINSLKRSDNKDVAFRKFIKKKFQGLMIPYISFSLINIIITLVTYVCGSNTVSPNLIRDEIIMFLLLKGFSVLWFLPALFLAEIIFFYVKRLKPLLMHITMLAICLISLGIVDIFKDPITYNSIIHLVTSSLLTVLGRTLIAVSFMWWGYVIVIIIDKLNPPKYLNIICGLLLLILNYPLGRATGSIDINTLSFANSYMFFITSCIASTGVILLCKCVPTEKILTYIGKNSLIIMVTHLDFCIIAVSSDLAYRLLNYIPKAKELALYLMIAIFIVIMEWILIKLFNKFFYKLLGK